MRRTSLIHFHEMLKTILLLLIALSFNLIHCLLNATQNQNNIVFSQVKAGNARKVSTLCLLFLSPAKIGTKTYKTNVHLSCVFIFFGKIDWLSTKPISEWEGIKCSCNQVMRIHFCRNNLTGFLPTQLKHLKSLWALDLRHNKLEGKLQKI